MSKAVGFSRGRVSRGLGDRKSRPHAPSCRFSLEEGAHLQAGVLNRHRHAVVLGVVHGAVHHTAQKFGRNRNLRHTTVVLDDVATTAGERPVATPPSSCMGAAEVDPLLPARRVCGSTPSSYATPSSEYVQTVATRVVYSRGYGAFYVSLLAASITELVWIFHPWRNHCCRSHTRPPCVRARRLQSMSSAHDPPFGCAPGSPTRRRLSSLSSSRTSH